MSFHRLLFCACFFILPVNAQEPPGQPILKIETGMHTARINDIRLDAANRTLVTASDDGTARAWRLPGGDLIRTFRIPLVPGRLGALKTAAISPDGSTVAVGGHTVKNTIYLFDLASGRRVGNIESLPDHVAYLLFSPDGRFLVATLEGPHGIRVWRTSDYQLAASDLNYGDSSFRADFSTDGRLATTSHDNHIRLYDHRFQLQRWFKLAPGRKPGGVAFSPDGKRIAVGYGVATPQTQRRKIEVFDGYTLDYLFSPKLKLLSLTPEVAWSADGRYLYGGGVGAKLSTLLGIAAKLTRSQPINYLFRWGRGGKGARRQIPSGAKNVITRIAPLREGGLVYAAIDPSIGTADSSREFYKSAPAPNFATLNTRPKYSRDGFEVQFNYDWIGNRPARFSLKKRYLNRRSAKRFDAAPWSCREPGLKLQINLFGDDGKFSYDGSAKLNGQYLADTRGARECSIAPDRQSFAIGTDDHLMLFNRKGKLLWKTAFGSAVYNITVIDDHWLAAGLADGTVRWVRLSDGEELVAMFAHIDERRWVLWTTSGYYDSSPEGDELLGWHLNQGTEDPEFLRASQLKQRMYRPDIIDQLIEVGDSEAVLADAGAAESSAQQLANPDNRPPVFSIVKPANGEKVRQETIPVHLNFKDQRGALPGRTITITVNGRQIPVSRTTDNSTLDTAAMEVGLDPGANLIEIVVSNDIGQSREWVSVDYEAPAATAADRRGNLYIVAVGVNDYTNLPNDLDFAAADAIGLHDLLREQAGSLYADVKSVLLADGQIIPNRANIEDALELFAEATPRDTVILFLAGHGINEGSEYYFLPQDSALGSNQRLRKSTVINWRILQRTLVNTSGRRILLVDTCHSGNAFNQRLVKDAADANIVVLTSTDRATLAQERRELGHGVFTYAMIEGLQGKADLIKDRLIKIKELDSYVADTVESITEGEQQPVLYVPGGFKNFPLVEVR